MGLAAPPRRPPLVLRASQPGCLPRGTAVGEDPAQPQKGLRAPDRGASALMVSPGGARPGSCREEHRSVGVPGPDQCPGALILFWAVVEQPWFCCFQAEPFSSPACWGLNSPYFIPGPYYPDSSLRACAPVSSQAPSPLSLGWGSQGEPQQWPSPCLNLPTQVEPRDPLAQISELFGVP